MPGFDRNAIMVSDAFQNFALPALRGCSDHLRDEKRRIVAQLNQVVGPVSHDLPQKNTPTGAGKTREDESF